MTTITEDEITNIKDYIDKFRDKFFMVYLGKNSIIPPPNPIMLGYPKETYVHIPNRTITYEGLKFNYEQRGDSDMIEKITVEDLIAEEKEIMMKENSGCEEHHFDIDTDDCDDYEMSTSEFLAYTKIVDTDSDVPFWKTTEFEESDFQIVDNQIQYKDDIPKFDKNDERYEFFKTFLKPIVDRYLMKWPNGDGISKKEDTDAAYERAMKFVI